MADGPKIAADDATRTRPDRWPDASAMAPGSFVEGPRTGDRVGRYLIEGRLGAGGMGIVALAKDPELSRQVALKVVRPGVGDRAYRQRLVREARAMAQLDHPNVVRVHDAGEADGEVFVAMEYVKGQTLGAWLKAARRPWREVVRRFVEAGRGLVAAHAAGLVHRDFKPDNVLVRDSDGRVAVSDFGLAAPVRDGDADAAVVTIPDPPREEATPISGDDSTIAVTPPTDAAIAAPVATPDSPLGAASFTATGAVIGTPSYMAPEQAGGAAVDARADIYSFCVALHEGVYGQRPFSIKPLPGGGFARGPIAGKLDDRGAPAALQRAIAKGLATEPADRWPSMAPLLETLTRLLARRRRAAIVGAAIVVVAGASAGAYALAGGPAVELCPAPTARLAGVWDVARKAALRDHLRAVDPAAGQSRFEAAARAFDAYAEGWSTMHVEACEATRVQGAQSDTLLDLRMRCLDRRITELRGAVGVLDATSTAAALDRAIATVSDLTPLDPCADAAALSQAVPPPDSPADRATATRLVVAADDVRDGVRAGQLDGLAERAAAIVTEARTLAHPPTLASALDTQARVARAVGDIPTLIADVQELVQVAAAAHDDVQVANALLDLILMVGRNQHNPDQALALLPAAEAAVTRVGSPLWMRATLLSNEGAVLAFTPRTQEAIEKSTQALQLAKEAVAKSTPATRPARTISMLNIQYALGVAKARSGATDEAVALFRDLVEQTRSVYGADHPEEAKAWVGLGNTFTQARKLDDAITSYRNAVRIRDHRFGDVPMLALTLHSLSTPLLYSGQFQEAIDALERARVILQAQAPVDNNALSDVLSGLSIARSHQEGGRELSIQLRDQQIALLTSPGSDPEKLAAALYNRADQSLEDRRYADAIPDLDQADALWARVGGAKAFMRIATMMRHGQCLIMLGKPQEAIALLTGARSLDTPGQAAYEKILAGYYLGRALYESGRDRTGGLEQVRAARTELVNSGDNYVDDVAELDAWLAKATGRGGKK